VNACSLSKKQHGTAPRHQNLTSLRTNTIRFYDQRILLFGMKKAQMVNYGIFGDSYDAA
jgi:hypothetical protein